jgi:succinyl-CoA synthetase alpha subunit
MPLVSPFGCPESGSRLAKLFQYAKLKGVRIIGPSSVGIISPGQAKIGAIGGGGLDRKVFSPGSVGVISKSGGMTSEISYIMTKAGIGQSTALGIGGDMLLGSDFTDIALLFEKDPETKSIVIFGEIGGTNEEQLARAIKNKLITKPVIALIAGEFSKDLSAGTILGHAGAIVMKGQGSFSSKVNALRHAGAIVVSSPEEIPAELMQLRKK